MNESIYSLFAEAVSLYRDETAIIENNRTLTFGELSNLVDEIARSFPGEVKTVGIVMSHRAEMIAAMLASLKKGATYVPAEPSFPAGRIRYMMTEATVDFVLTERKFSDRLNGLTLRFLDGGGFEPQATPAPSKAESKPARPAYVLYTSGTTGRPKGVAVTNGNVCHYVRAFATEFHPGVGDVMLQYSVCSFDIFVEEVYASLLNGAALAIPAEEDKADILALMAFIEKHRVTIVSGFPYLLAEMNRLKAIPPSLRLLVSGGDVLRGSYVDRLIGQVEVYNTYGPSETTVCATYYRCNGGSVLPDGTYPIGHPIKGVEIRILDSHGVEVSPGQTGEICIAGDGVAQGYIGDHAKENEAFTELPDGCRMYLSGDLGYYLPDGNIAFLRRLDTQIMIYGKRVEIAEVESALNRCRGVEHAVVRACTDDSGLAYMTAYVVLSDQDLKVSDIRKELSNTLTTYMIPEFFVKIARIPLTDRGKPDLQKLPIVMKAGIY